MTKDQMQEAVQQSPTPVELRAKRNEILRIATLHHVNNIRVFGSVARGEATARSDIDFLVDVPSECEGWDFFGVLDDLRQDLEGVRRRVDVISIRGPAPDAKGMAAAIELEALAL